MCQEKNNPLERPYFSPKNNKEMKNFKNYFPLKPRLSLGA